MTGHKDKWEVYKDNSGEWRWKRTATNGKIVGASTEGYKNQGDCEENAIRNGMPAHNDKWEIYEDDDKEWRWTRTASNGKIVGASTEGYKNRTDCEANAVRNGYVESND